jgi:glycosyltransferase involved in cell wall biosynthesis
MIKIAFLNVMDCYSGGEIVLRRLILSLDPKEYQKFIYSLETQFIEDFQQKPVHIRPITHKFQLGTRRNFMELFKIINNFIIAYRLCRIMKKIDNIDLIHSNGMVSNVYFAPFAKFLDIPFVAHSHEIRYGFFYKVLHYFIAFFSNHIICVSEAVRKNWLSHGVREKKLSVIYNGLPDDFF